MKKIYFKSLFFITAGVVFYLAIIPNDHVQMTFEHADKVKHFIAFFTLSLLLNRASSTYMHRLRNITALLLFGVLIEIVQSFLAYRTAGYDDIIADLVGILTFQLFFSLLRFYRHQKKRKAPYITPSSQTFR